MRATENGDTFNCSCGFSWQRGQSGAHNCEPGLYRQIDALQQNLNAVTAENVALKSFVENRCWLYDASVEGYRDAVSYLPETPATDAILNALRAEGVDMFAANERKWAAHWEKRGVQDGSVSRSLMVAQDADKFAEKLRNVEYDAKDDE